MADATIRVTEDPNRVEAEYLGRAHSGAWDDDCNVYGDPGSDESLLAACLCAWDGSPEMKVSDEQLELDGGGHWARP